MARTPSQNDPFHEGIAEESHKTRKARKKLQKQLEELDRKITPQALERKTIEIQRWIDRHAPTRIILKGKNICLFDENQNTASISEKVKWIAEQLKR